MPGRQSWLGPERVTWLGLVCNVLLAGGKIAVGTAFHSRAVLADGVHSLTDLLSDFTTLLSLRSSTLPADSSHPYGHLRIQTLGAMAIGLILLLAAGWIGYDAFASLQTVPEPITGLWPLVVAAATVPLKELLYRLSMFVAGQCNSLVVRANAWHHRSDAMTSLAAAAGIAGAMFLGPAWARLDAVTAMLLAGFLAVASGRMIYDAAGELIDRAPSEGMRTRLSQIALQTPGVQDCHALRARTLAGQVEMDLHVLVEPDLTVRQGHDIATDVKQRIMAADSSVHQVVVHIEPADAPR